uniref:Uncharacterized protein n=1 Tax=Physcomitrium patens TaxID=3218 RepID=A0A2K1L328_PHYPA|nr:hypothetical protein PHYPA_003225 [Physcomitrium patens]
MSMASLCDHGRRLLQTHLHRVVLVVGALLFQHILRKDLPYAEGLLHCDLGDAHLMGCVDPLQIGVGNL